MPDRSLVPVHDPDYDNPTVGARLVYQITGMATVDITAHLRYVSRAGELFGLDVYRPVEQTRPLPVVLLGGPPAFHAGRSSGQKIGWAQLIAASGLAAAVFDTRSDGFLKTPEEPAADVASALDFIRANARDLRVDATRIATFGFSIGTAPWHLWAALHEEQPSIRANVAYYALLDLVNSGLEVDADHVRPYSALTLLQQRGGRIPPMLIAKAGRDRFAAINPSIDLFVATARELGANVELLVHDEGQHGFDSRDNDDRSREIIHRTLTFLREQLLPMD